MATISAIWASLGEAGHLAVYALGMSLLGAILQYLASKGGALGKVGSLGKTVVDALSANLPHPPPPVVPPKA